MQHFVWPGINFSWQAQYFRQVEWKNRKTQRYEAVSSALNFPFLKEVSQNSCVFDVVEFKNWRSLAELLRFGCCPVQKWRSVAELLRVWMFLMLSTSKNEEFTQNCCVFLMLSSLKNEEVAQNRCVFWCCQTLKHEEVSQNSWVFKVADRQVDR